MLRWTASLLDPREYPNTPFLQESRMTDETIVAVYDTAAEAEAAVRDLKAADVRAEAISRHAETAPGAAATEAPAREQGFWASLFGAEPDHDASVLDRSIES